jgi:hypothetical protein
MSTSTKRVRLLLDAFMITSVYLFTNQLPVPATHQLEDSPGHLARLLLEHGKHIHRFVESRRSDGRLLNSTLCVALAGSGWPFGLPIAWFLATV